MDVCSRNPNRTAPVGEDGPRRTNVLICSRTNGWSWPPHPFQLLAWLLYVYFAVTGLGVFVPLLPAHWIPAGYICTGVMFVCHLCVHVMAVSIDPADHNVRSKSHRGPVPAFDRSKHAHVIENCHCYLCQVDVGPKSKHCSACNKCVANFDHHCRWLNNCVGSRNYKLFLHSVLSALLGVCLVLVVASYVFVEFFVDPSRLRTDHHFLLRNDSSMWFVFLPVAPLSSVAAVIPGLAAVTIALALLSSVLLSHLLCFHIYLMWNRLSTYEYIVRQRHRQDGRNSENPGAVKEAAASSVNHIKVTDALLACWLAHVTARTSFYPKPHFQQRKKKKKIRKVAVERSREHGPKTGFVSTVSLAQRLPFPAFPLRASLPPLSPAPGPVQAAAPPAEYHSDSAESLEEIPVVLAKLGSSSSATAGDTYTSSQRLAVLPVPSPQLRTKRKAPIRAAELRFEITSAHLPTVFVSQASGEAPEPCKEELSVGRRQTGPKAAYRPSLGSGLVSWMEL
uniref:Palmitoyltransferase n=1 Tax=Mola mola TaxID=94237 RepID=A0A3Q4AI61_MOLML